MWSGVNKTIAQKREFLTNSIPNTQLIDLIISCMDDNPYIRPTAALIASALEGFNQLDFSSKKLPQNMNQSILFTAGALKPGEKRGASSLKYESTSDIYKYTAGKFVMVEIGLDQTTTWPEFLTAFCGSFGIEQGFNAALFKSKVNPVANRVTVNVLDKGVFKDVQPLLLDSTDDMKQLWIEDLYTFIEDLKIELS
ncbi:hypothetical protein HDV02_005630 [Globomyces sp. JEL0801]|nr:hypothetical protein HDV02_005630 [Globomyces sp. JEL0801]